MRVHLEISGSFMHSKSQGVSPERHGRRRTTPSSSKLSTNGLRCPRAACTHTVVNQEGENTRTCQTSGRYATDVRRISPEQKNRRRRALTAGRLLQLAELLEVQLLRHPQRRSITIFDGHVKAGASEHREGVIDEQHRGTRCYALVPRLLAHKEAKLIR